MYNSSTKKKTQRRVIVSFSLNQKNKQTCSHHNERHELFSSEILFNKISKYKTFNINYDTYENKK